jgi:hypothetical protein
LESRRCLRERPLRVFGGQDFSDSGGSNLLSSGDTSHIGELHLRIEDHTTKTYAKAIAAFRQPDGSVRASAWFRFLLARP